MSGSMQTSLSKSRETSLGNITSPTKKELSEREKQEFFEWALKCHSYFSSLSSFREFARKVFVRKKDEFPSSLRDVTRQIKGAYQLVSEQGMSLDELLRRCFSRGILEKLFLSENPFENVRKLHIVAEEFNKGREL